ncbi:MAG: glycerol-3-phosphate 1-O-acyltransferase PlsY [Clostridia bacterium]|nr:glycerol-3-phosphate 1-O-acyltransferase PlsY [Clostridia bacterium]
MIIIALAIIAAYFIGSINFAVIFTRAFESKDIREHGSGNAGTTNVMRVGGFLPGMLTFLFDALKGFVASILGKMVFDYVSVNYNITWTAPLAGAYICGVACIIGHIFPLFFKFKGGKGVATCVGIFAVCCPIAIIAGLAFFALITILSRYVSLASLSATVVVVVLATVFRTPDTPEIIQIICCLIMAFLIFYKHKGNIKRLVAGNENRIGK